MTVYVFGQAELDMRTRTRRGAAARETELRRYASAEWNGPVSCLLTDGNGKCHDGHIEETTVYDNKLIEVRSKATAPQCPESV